MEIKGKIKELGPIIEITEDGKTSKQRGVIISNKYGKGYICIYIYDDQIVNFNFPPGSIISFDIRVEPYLSENLMLNIFKCNSFFKVDESGFLSLLGYVSHVQTTDAIIHKMNFHINSDGKTSEKVVDVECTIDGKRQLLPAYKLNIDDRLFLLSDFPAEISLQPQKSGKPIIGNIRIDLEKLSERQFLIYLGPKDIEK